ncbi:MAG TPA: hypothetical protein VHM70_01040, partial [Polyangiaceae bacterium]|nr:hypothetical protein [Polyangiaceae bacterium]
LVAGDNQESLLPARRLRLEFKANPLVGWRRTFRLWTTLGANALARRVIVILDEPPNRQTAK